MDFDETRLYYSHQRLQGPPRNVDSNAANDRDAEDEAEMANLDAVRRHFREFLRNYRTDKQRYLYREKLTKMHRRLTRKRKSHSDNETANINKASDNTAQLEVDVAHLGEYDSALLGYLRDQPASILPQMERAASDALKTLLFENASNNAVENENDDENNDGGVNAALVVFSIQLLLTGNLAMTPLRSIKSEHMNKLIKCPGIVISASPVRCRAVRLLVRCGRCLDERTVESSDGPFGSMSLPARCSGPDPGACGPSPYGVVPDSSDFVDRQTLKLQEAPETVPTGELPRSVLLAVERSLVDRAPPGTRVATFCIPTLFQGVSSDAGVKSVYLRVVGMAKDDNSLEVSSVSAAEEEAFTKLARRKDVYDILTRSVAPSIQGSYTMDIKRALVCMLMGGTGKRQPDGVRLRGDINVLLLGDPSTAKSQFLKFVSRVSPIGIYTSGKGSSAAGLTASVVRDSRGEFYLEGGAMVLADGGIVCIDEFDKMRPADRVAIHEAMEQQTISVAKAGITTVLNSRSAVLAAANPVFGRYDDLKSAAEQIDLMTTILSRFDLIFLVRDVREEERDRMICRHVMGVHIQNSHLSNGRSISRGDSVEGALPFVSADSGMPTGSEDEGAAGNLGSHESVAENAMRVATSGIGELNVATMKRFVQFCRANCRPVLSEEAGRLLSSSYVKIRHDVLQGARQAMSNESSQTTIPITVRQLEALVRVSESLAKLRLESEVQIDDVNEALRLFRVSTMEANSADKNINRVSLFAPNGQAEQVERVQSFLSSRLSIGNMVNKQKLVEEASGQGFDALLVARVIAVMSMQGDVLERSQGRLLKRVK